MSKAVLGDRTRRTVTRRNTRLPDMADTTFDFGIIAGGTGPLRELKAGDVIFKQGDAGQELFFIKSGKVEIRIGNRVLDTLSHREYLRRDGADRLSSAQCHGRCDN